MTNAARYGAAGHFEGYAGPSTTPDIHVHPPPAAEPQTLGGLQPSHSRRHHHRRRTTGYLTRSQPGGLPTMPESSITSDDGLLSPVSAEWLTAGSYLLGDRLVHEGAFSTAEQSAHICLPATSAPQTPTRSSRSYDCDYPGCEKSFNKPSDLK